MTSESIPEKQSLPTGPEGGVQIQTNYVQKVKRNFSPTAILATCVSLMATWEALCSTMATGLTNGGPASLVYGAVIAFLGSLCSAMSLAELASIHPTAGGQYHFVAHLSSGRKGQVHSCTLGWVALAGSAPFLAGTQIQGLLIFNYPDSYTFERWHGTMLYWAILLGSALVCIFCSNVLPLLGKITMALHVGFYLIILIVMAIVSPTKHSASFVFATFGNNSGWSNDGIAWCIGLLSCCYVLMGYDGATHLSEEMENADIGVPRAMVGCVVINGALGFTFLITLLFCMGDIELALNSPTGFPIIQIFYNITGTLAATNALTAAVTIMATISTISLITSAARVIWAFARDQGLPFSQVVSKVERKRGIPTVAIIVTTCLLVLLGLINIGSTTAFNAILSLAVVSLQASYLFPIILVLWRRIFRPETLVWGPWRLGRIGVVVNVIAVCYLVFTCVFLFLPPFYPVTALNMNYAPVVLGAALLFGASYWLLRARKRYVGPLTELHVMNGRVSA
ncbi:amino acid/polyamine transporter I [Colletotrichum godetiae]|uniref:Amino acid/polyamine transporter I n=1 Tax=Colletotrichum godetiae TaxID=1209918 RepID=A0AAJ0AMZ8_9PEZI|nr:amino acid/polyamine transporter I [Colletotrichum godetiae]KAK1675403.1 amino acid/polyamine transporter I [Colletotrichum godetiae]